MAENVAEHLAAPKAEQMAQARVSETFANDRGSLKHWQRKWVEQEEEKFNGELDQRVTRREEELLLEFAQRTDEWIDNERGKCTEAAEANADMKSRARYQKWVAEDKIEWITSEREQNTKNLDDWKNNHRAVEKIKRNDTD